MKAWLISALSILLGMVLLAACWAAWLQRSGNFHEVLAGELYRSAQPSVAQLGQWTAAEGLRSVVNLRGPSRAAWYRDERDMSRRLGLHHADFPMHDDEMLSAPDAARLVALLQNLPKPVLIHCKAGADRTGLAAALYLASRDRPEAAAEAQLSFRYGHVSLPLSTAWPMNLAWEALEPSFGYDS